MDFVREHKNAFFVADFGHLVQLFFCPDDATRIVRIAEDEHLASLDLLAESFHIHAVGTIHQLQRIGHQSAVGTGVQPMERTIYRRLDHHLVARLGKGIERHAQTRHNARYEVNHFLLHLQSVAVLVPIHNRLVIAFRLGGISQHGIFQTTANSFGHERSCCKIHIGYPKWQQIVSSPYFFDAFHLDGRSSASVYHFIKIVFHKYSRFIRYYVTKL